MAEWDVGILSVGLIAVPNALSKNDACKVVSLLQLLSGLAVFCLQVWLRFFKCVQKSLDLVVTDQVLDDDCLLPLSINCGFLLVSFVYMHFNGRIPRLRAINLCFELSSVSLSL